MRFKVKMSVNEKVLQFRAGMLLVWIIFFYLYNFRCSFFNDSLLEFICN